MARKRGQPTRLQRLRMSMRAFDRLPKEFRQFIAYYPRTTSGAALEGILANAQGNVLQAMNLVRYLMPVEREFDGAPLFTAFPPAEPPEDERMADLFDMAAD